MLVNPGIDPVHPCYIANNSDQVSEVSSCLIVGIVARAIRSRYVEIDRFQVHRQIRAAWVNVSCRPTSYNRSGLSIPCEEPIMVSQTKMVCHIRVFSAQSAADEPQDRPAL